MILLTASYSVVHSPFKRLLTLGLSCIALGHTASSLRAESTNAFALEDGDRVLFYGDSITEQNLYNTFVETFVITRFPQLNISFQHAGWGGDSVNGGGGGPIDVRLERDVFPYKPSVMTIMLGMNDGRYHAFDQSFFDTYVHGYQHILNRVQTILPQARVYVIQPSPYDDVTRVPLFEGGYNTVLQRYGAAVADLAKQHHDEIIDLNSPVVSALRLANAIDPTATQKIIPDRVHPSPAGHLVMAAAILKAWHAPSLVSSVEIDAAAKKVIVSDNTKLSQLSIDPKLSWEQLDAALPFPINERDSLIELADRAGNITAKLNQELLKVSGLSANAYTLIIDGQTVARFTKEELARGINLAPFDTPMYRRADEIYQLSLQHNRTHYVKWRQGELGVGEIKTKNVARLLGELSKELDDEEAAMVKKQHDLAHPVSHHYQLVSTDS